MKLLDCPQQGNQPLTDSEDELVECLSLSTKSSAKANLPVSAMLNGFYWRETDGQVFKLTAFLKRSHTLGRKS